MQLCPYTGERFPNILISFTALFTINILLPP